MHGPVGRFICVHSLVDVSPIVVTFEKKGYNGGRALVELWGPKALLISRKLRIPYVSSCADRLSVLRLTVKRETAQTGR